MYVRCGGNGAARSKTDSAEVPLVAHGRKSEGGKRAEQRGLKSLCLPSWSSGFGSKAES